MGKYAVLYSPSTNIYHIIFINEGELTWQYFLKVGRKDYAEEIVTALNNMEEARQSLILDERKSSG